MHGAGLPPMAHPLPLHRNKGSAGTGQEAWPPFVLQMERLRPEISPGHIANESGPGTGMQSSELTLRGLPTTGPIILLSFFVCLHSDLLGSRKLLWTVWLTAEGPAEPPGIGFQPLSWAQGVPPAGSLWPLGLPPQCFPSS